MYVLGIDNVTCIYFSLDWHYRLVEICCSIIFEHFLFVKIVLRFWYVGFSKIQILDYETAWSLINPGGRTVVFFPCINVSWNLLGSCLIGSHVTSP